MNSISLKWKMINYNLFKSDYNGYEIELTNGGFLGYCSWVIFKDNQIVDSSLYHKPIKSELGGKAQIERILYKIINI